MRFSLSLLFLFCIYSVVSEEGISDEEQEAKRKKILGQLSRTRTELLDDYHLVTRQSAINVYMFRSYRTVSVIFYPITRDITDARFNFQAEVLHLNNIGTCENQDVIINLKHGSYPAVNPDGYDFPKNFINEGKREEIHNLEFISDGRNISYSIQNPKPGNWYALAYIKWVDPRTERVEQQGLAPDCQTILYTDLQVRRQDDIEQIDCNSGIIINEIDLPKNFKCMAADSLQAVKLEISINNAPQNFKVFVKIQAQSLPTADKYMLYCYFEPILSGTQSIFFETSPNTWHYLTVGELKNNLDRVANCQAYTLRTDENVDNNTVLELMRDDKGRFFTYDFGLPTTDIHDATSIVNITSNEVTTVRYKVNQFHDIGGTLIIETSLLMPLKYYMGYKRPLTSNGLLEFSVDNPYLKVVICMDIGHASVPLENGQCRYNDRIRPALFVLNSTDSDSVYDKIVIPYPDSGVWYLSFRLFCDSTVCPCKASEDGKKYYVDPNALIKGYVEFDLKNNRVGSTQCNASIVLSITSNTCVSGKCLNQGNCLLNTFGGMVMSYCQCTSGYGAWDCSDDSRMDSRASMLVSILLLTLSNLLFFLAIYVAIIRLHYTEAMVFTFTMVFSTFYHACDAPPQIAYCIIRRHILQFGDFFCGLMAFWVTLLAMTIINDTYKTLFLLLGAIVLAILTTWNMHSLITFIVPVSVGVAIVLISWFLNYRKNKKWKFSRSYYSRYFPAGLVLVGVGLICFAFLQTEQNYKIVHSIWHVIIALSVVCLLPDNKRGDDAKPFLPSPEFGVLFRNKFRRNQTPLTE